MPFTAAQRRERNRRPPEYYRAIRKNSIFYQTRQSRARNAIREILGKSCACCGSTEKLEVDHRTPRRGVGRIKEAARLAAQVKKHPDQFQMLCAKCNNWKCDGPICPCRYWDTISHEWRA